METAAKEAEEKSPPSKPRTGRFVNFHDCAIRNHSFDLNILELSFKPTETPAIPKNPKEPTSKMYIRGLPRMTRLPVIAVDHQENQASQEIGNITSPKPSRGTEH
jgi:hypothetical protein